MFKPIERLGSVVSPADSEPRIVRCWLAKSLMLVSLCTASLPALSGDGAAVPPGASASSPQGAAPEPRPPQGATSTAGGDPGVCSSDRQVATKAFVSGKALPSSPAAVRLQGLWQFLPSNGLAQLYLFTKYGSQGPLKYRVFVTKYPYKTDEPLDVLQLAIDDEVLAENAGSHLPAQLKNDLSEKTLVQFESHPWDRGSSSDWGRQRARVTVVGCTVDEGPPVIFGAFDTKISSVWWSAWIAFAVGAAFYFLAAFTAFHRRHRNRVIKDLPPGFSDFNPFSSAHRRAVTDWQGSPITGTNYASFWTHLDPVVLTAGPNGKGSPTKLQVLFFTIVVFSVMLYIFLLTGHLVSLSTKILLLLGISGLGALASGGAEMAKNRLSFENYAWLIKNKWLPRGGIAEENLAEWKDIFTSDGEFDVTRFQMIIFTFMVAMSLIGFAYRVNDLADFDISDALLGLLGLSQVVFVSGKLIAPPSIRDLDNKLNKLQEAEIALRDARDRAGLSGVAFIFGTKSNEVIDAAKAYTDYKAIWSSARAMFESTLGRDVPDEAENYCPPFTMAQLTDNEVIRLQAVKAKQPFVVQLIALPAGSYSWSLDSPESWLGFVQSPAPTGAAADVQATPPAPGQYAFTVTVEDANQTRKIRSFSFEAS